MPKTDNNNQDIYDAAAYLSEDYREALEEYYSNSVGSNVWKLQNFSKYVPRQALTRFIIRHEIFKMVLNVQGSVAELGVLDGGSLLSWAHLSSIFEPLNYQRKVIGFDMFGEHPTTSEKDKTGKSSHIYDNKRFTLDAYQDIKNSVCVLDKNRPMGEIEKVILVKGDASKSVPEYIEKHPETLISLLYLDINLYEPTRVALEQFIPRMPKGAIIVFDELNDRGFPGETIAVIETIGIRNLRIQRFPYDTKISYAILD